MKRLCVFYKNAADYHKYGIRKKPVEWIVCKECQSQLRQGRIRRLMDKAVTDGSYPRGGQGN